MSCNDENFIWLKYEKMKKQLTFHIRKRYMTNRYKILRRNLYECVPWFYTNRRMKEVYFFYNLCEFEMKTSVIFR